MDRCAECGSWEAQCAADTPVKGCGCARCLSATLYGLRRELEVAQAFHNVAIKERDLAFEQLRRAEKQIAALLEGER